MTRKVRQGPWRHTPMLAHLRSLTRAFFFSSANTTVSVDYVRNRRKALSSWLKWKHRADPALPAYDIRTFSPAGNHISRDVRKCTFWHVRSTKTPVSLCIHAVWSVSVVRMKKPHRLLSKMRLLEILMRLRECAVWSESSLGAYVRRYVFWQCCSCISHAWKKSK